MLMNVKLHFPVILMQPVLIPLVAMNVHVMLDLWELEEHVKVRL